MRRLHKFAFAIAGVISTIGPAKACIMLSSLELSDVLMADVVVIGQATNYQTIEDHVQREQWQRYLEHLSPEQREAQAERSGFLGDYARFDIEISTVLRGEVEGVIGVTWDNSTFGEPASMSKGPYLIALRASGTPLLPLRGPSATILPDPEPGLWSVLQAPCAPPFIFESQSERAEAIQELLSAAPQ